MYKKEKRLGKKRWIILTKRKNVKHLYNSLCVCFFGSSKKGKASKEKQMDHFDEKKECKIFI